MNLDPSKTFYYMEVQTPSTPFLSLDKSCFEAGSTVTVRDECFRDQWRSYPATQLIAKEKAVQFVSSNRSSWGVQQKKEQIPFSCTRMATQNMKAERKINRILQLNLDLQDSE